jgi:hypothetical protein
VVSGRSCRAEVSVPLSVMIAALSYPGVEWGDLSRYPVCVLEEHGPGTFHQGVACEVGRDQAVWVYWDEGNPPSDVAVRTDCPATGGTDGGGCSGYVGHPGRHTFELPYPLGVETDNF